MWGEAPGLPDSWRAGRGSWALALAGQCGPGLPAHVRGLRGGTPLGGDGRSLRAQASLGAAGQEGASAAFSVWPAVCPV